MIRPDAELHGETTFREWASLFSGKYFAMLVLYADETGTHGIKKDGKEPAPGVYGFLATPDIWDKFRVEWRTALSQPKYDVPYFHFRELIYERGSSKCPYHGWDNDKVDDFIYDMALIAGSGPVPIGGNVSQKKTVGPNPNKFQIKKLFRQVFYQFFGDFKLTMQEQFQDEQGKVTFFFSDNDNDDWILILSQIIKDARHRNPQIGGYAFIDPYCSSDRGLPCQAADLFAFVNRQNSANMYEAGHVRRMRILDLIIGRHAFPKHHPGHALTTIPEDEWRELVADMRKQRKEFESQNQKLDVEKRTYFPTRDHPVINKLINKRRY
jgi:hypothetical protein